MPLSFVQLIRTYFWHIIVIFVVIYSVSLPEIIYQNFTNLLYNDVIPVQDQVILLNAGSQPSNFMDLERFDKPFHSLLTNYSSSPKTLPVKNPSSSLLCNIGLQAHCNSYQVAEVLQSFWVICPIYAPYQSRIKIRYQLHENYANYIQSFGIPFSTAEAIRKDRHQTYLLTKPNSEPENIQLQIYDDGYLRESLLNVAAKKIPGWEYMSWIDTHQPFENNYWWEEAIVRLEKYASVQFFQYLQAFTVDNVTKNFAPSALYVANIQSRLGGLPFVLGNAFGIRKDYYDKIGYVFDECIGGCCDCAYVKGSLPANFSFDFWYMWKSYTEKMMPWVNHTQSIFKGSRHIVRGILYHLYHEETFPYMNIMSMIRDSDFNIQKDLQRDANGTVMLANKSLKWRVETFVFLWCFWTPIMSIIIIIGLIVAYNLYKLYLRWKNKNNNSPSS